MRRKYLLFSLLMLFAYDLYSQNNQWVWMKGDEGIVNTNYGVYGTQNVGSVQNRPGRRRGAVTWKDAAGNFWLFGGNGYAETQTGYLNDLWKYNPVTNQWTWISGTKLTNQIGIYGTVTVPASTNMPGCRTGAVGWIDASGNLWMFGGNGYVNNFFEERLNDLWKYDPVTNQWTWMKGDKGTASGNYGTINVAAAGNKPGSRRFAVATKDNSGNFYLFGGYGDSEFSIGQLNDLWRYNIATNQWTWIKGDKTANSLGVYGTQGTPAGANKPGGRNNSVLASDATYLWLFSGEGYPETGSYGWLNDLWRYNLSTGQWTWMKGAKVRNDPGVYGSITVPAAANKPGARYESSAVMDASGNLWIMDGYGYGESNTGYLNDVWRYNIAANQWTWMKGDKATGSSTVYGTQGVAAAPNKPGGRSGSQLWYESAGNIWIFSGTNNNELWKFNIASTNWTWVRDFSRTGSSAYGTIGVAASSNYPGNREEMSTWTDDIGNLWMFGGSGEGGLFQQGYLNDLWKYNPATNQWTWIKGDSLADMTGIYGTINTAAAANKPGARYQAMSWTDNTGKLWLFGGYGNPSSVPSGYLNDLWKFDPSTNMWTWVHGNNSRDVSGVYGTTGVPAAGNKPGSRIDGTTWTDNSGNLWLFGGYGYSESGGSGYLNDLWKFNVNTSQWTFVKGNRNSNIYGEYGIMGTSSSTVFPGSRSGSAGSVDPSGNLWLFGGWGFNESNSGRLNDLWKYETGTGNWTWVNGSSFSNPDPVYGFQGVPSPTANPGARSYLTSWFSNSGDFYICGGEGNNYDLLNDLWRFNTSSGNWTWLKGSSIPNTPGSYGVISVPDPSNTPGGRYGHGGWKTNDGKLWLFGGYGIDDIQYNNYDLNDLWNINPCSGNLLISPTSGGLCFGVNSVQLTVSGGGPLYEWYKDGVLIPGQTGVTYTATASGSYYAKSASGFCDLFSPEVIITGASVEPSLGGNGVYCDGAGVNIGIPVVQDDQDYTWFRGGAIQHYFPIGGSGNGGNQSLNFDMQAFRQGTYIVESTKPGCDTVYSNNVSVYYGGVTDLQTTSVCSNQVSFNWWDYGSPVKRFQYAVTQFSSPPANGNTVSSTSVTAGGLLPSTNYYIHVRGATIRDFDLNFLSFCDDWVTIPFTTLAAPLNPALSPSSATFCDGGAQLLTATGGDTYQWTRNGTIINGVSGNTYNATLPGTYTVIAFINGCNQGSSPSNNSVITVNPLPTGTISPAAASICAGNSQLLTVSGGTSYQWSRNGTPIGGAVNATYSATLAGTYTVVINNGTCSGPATNNAVITVTPLPTGTISPASATICSGASQLLTVSGGTSYQWSRNGTPIGGAVNATYSATLAGTYTVVINNGTCSGPATNSAVITVTPAPIGTISPASATICSGSSQLLTVSGGTSYQWSRNGTPISGAVNATYSATLAGTYTVVINNGTCTGPAANSAVITVAPLPAGTISPASATICAGASQLLTVSGGTSYQWSRNGTPIGGAVNATYAATLAGTYTVIINDGSCSGPATNSAVITVSPLPTGTITPASATICAGSSQLLTVSGGTSYQWSRNGTPIGGAVNATYSASLPGTYTVVINNGICSGPATNSAVITVTPLPTGTISPANATICTGSSQLLTVSGGTSYQWSRNGTPISGAVNATYTATLAGTYSVVITNSGCSAPATNTSVIIVNPVSASTTNISICTNQLPYTWNGNSYSSAGTYTVTLTGANGCDSIATLNLAVNAVLTSTTNAAVCTNQLPYVWNGNNYNASGSYNVTLTSQSGCDSIATLNLTVKPVLTSTTTASTCTNQLPYVWNGNNYNASGTYTVTLAGSNGCDSVATLNLTVKPVLASTTNASACTNQLPYVWNGNNYTATGTYTVTLTGSNGCDSVATLNLTIKPVSVSTTNISICTNQLPYTWNGNSYSSAGTYNVTLTGANGCDSIATLNLAVNAVLTSTTNAAVCSNQLPYVWNGNNYNASGSYNVTLTSQSGCDSIATLILTVNPVLTSITNVTRCSNQLPYVWNGNSYSTAGTYTITLTGTNGCDSLATLNLTVNPVVSSTTNVSICSNQLPYVWNGNSYTTAGSYSVILVSSSGCDSTALLNLAVNPVLTSTTNVSICTNQLPYTWNGNSYNTAGSYTVVLTTTAGCDSIATLNLSVNPVLTSITNVTVCSNQLPYTWNGNSYTTAGTYNVTLTTTAGCDSIATLNLVVNPVLNSTTNATVCSNQLPYVWNGNNYSGAGTYSVTLAGSNGCDSVATLNLSVNPVLTSTTNVAVCSNQLPYVWNGNNYTAAGTYSVILTTTAGCDSIATLNLTVNPVLTSTTNASVCSNQLPYNWNGNTYNAAGTYTVMLTTTAGCDSIATLNLSVRPVLTSTSNAATCSNQLPYIWNGNNYTASGTYTVTLAGSNGCDSVATLILVVKPVSTSQTMAVVCANQLPYTWNGNNYNTAGTYNLTFTGSNGCDSIATLVLTVNTVPAGSVSPVNPVICPGSSQLFTVTGGTVYQWFFNGTAIPGANAPTYSATLPGAYTARITGANGCQAMASNSSSLSLYVKPVASFSTGSVCEDEPTVFTNLSQVSGSGAVSWKWNFGDGTGSAVFAPSHTYNAAGTFTATLIITSAACPLLADTSSKQLTIIPAIPGVKYPAVNVLKNNPTTLSARNIGQQYLWQPVTGLNNPSIFNPVVTTASNKEYTITITTGTGCHIVDTLLVNVFDKSEVFVPKAFTPNRNNTNDVLRPLLVGVVSIDYFRVYNRWGQLVFQTQTIGDGWDGNFKNTAQPMETYSWVFAGKAADGTVIKANGKTVLIR